MLTTTQSFTGHRHWGEHWGLSDDVLSHLNAISVVTILPQIRLVKKTQMNQGKTLYNATSWSTTGFFTPWSDWWEPPTTFFLQELDQRFLSTVWNQLIDTELLTFHSLWILSGQKHPCVFVKVLLIHSKEIHRRIWWNNPFTFSQMQKKQHKSNISIVFYNLASNKWLFLIPLSIKTHLFEILKSCVSKYEEWRIRYKW